MIFIILLIVVLILIIISWVNLINDCKNVSMRGPLPLPLIGNGYLFLEDSSQFLKALEKLALKYDDAARFHLFSDRFVVLSHPKYIEHIVSSTELITKGLSYKFITPWLGEGLLMSTGYKWKKQRKFLTPAFHFNILQVFFPVFCKNAQVLRLKLDKLADNRPVNIFPIMTFNALDNVMESIMGVSINAQKDTESSYVKALDTISRIIMLRIRNPFLGDEILFNMLPLKKQHDEALNVLHGYTMNVIQARKEELEKADITSLGIESELGVKNKHAFLDLLLLGEPDGKKIDMEEIREQVDTFMFEGHDTTASGMSFCLYNIANHSDVQEKLYREQKVIFADDMDRDPTFKELSEMKYMDMVIKESLRLHPSVPLIQRKATQDIVTPEMRIGKNTSIFINIFQIQRNPNVFENPLEFNPERFRNKTNQRNAFAWLPFSAGPRNCIGQRFALMEMKITIASIVRNFILLPVAEPKLCADMILRAQDGIYIKMLPRN